MAMLKSLLAAIVAVGLIVGALYLRSSLVEGDDDPVAGGGAATEVPAGGELAVACADVLGSGCPAGSSRLDLDGLLAAFAASPPEFGVLVAPSVVVEFIEQSQTSQATFAAERPVVAVTPLVLAVSTSLDEVVADACGPEVTWSCTAGMITDRALEPALADVQTRTDGLVGYAALTGGFFDSTAYTRNSLGGSDFIGWLDSLDEQASRAAEPVRQLIQFNGARNNAAVQLEATGLATARSAAQNQPDVFWPTPLASLHVVVVGLEGVDADAVEAVARPVGAALMEAGWRGPDGAPLDEGPPVPPGEAGLPSGGTLFALRERLS